ncbi:MAG: alpha/beta hydrolase [Candidatus Dormibacteraceae bacterium]
MKETEPTFTHRFIPAGRVGAPTLLLLHGTGGDESDLLPLARDLLPGAALLSPRGKVLEDGMPRYFRRLAVGEYDLDDLRLRTQELADLVAAATRRYGLDEERVVAVGYSNGANMAASLLLSRPEVLAGAVLLRAGVPFEPEAAPALEGVAVLISAGVQDPYHPIERVERLRRLLEDGGATVELRWSPGGHSLTREELDGAARWLRDAVPASRMGVTQ